MNENEMLDVTKEVAKKIAKDAYEDAGKPIAKPTGELLGLVPRAIKAALLPVEKWILTRENNLEETRLLLEQKLENVSPEMIESPEPYIAVPALQYISYCMDNEELRDMYANLLANSMNKVVKNGVHPGFVEIIKQLCPDEAKFLKYLSTNTIIPTITLKYVDEKHQGINIVDDFSDVPEKIGCEKPYDVSKYIDNLVRLGLLQRSTLSSFTDKSNYEPLKNHKYIKQFDDPVRIALYGMKKCDFDEEYVKLTAFGLSFCKICMSHSKTTVTIHRGDS